MSPVLVTVMKSTEMKWNTWFDPWESISNLKNLNNKRDLVVACGLPLFFCFCENKCGIIVQSL